MLAACDLQEPVSVKVSAEVKNVCSSVAQLGTLADRLLASISEKRICFMKTPVLRIRNLRINA